MMHLYSTLLCIAVHTKRFTIVCVGGGGKNPQFLSIASETQEKSHDIPGSFQNIHNCIKQKLFTEGFFVEPEMGNPFGSFIL